MSRSFVDLLVRQAVEDPERVAYRFLVDGDTEESLLCVGDLDRRARVLAARLANAGAAGERVLILVPPSIDNVVAFFACLYAGAIAVPMAPPRRARADGKLAAIRDRAEARFVVADAATRTRIARSGELPTDAPDDLLWFDVAETDAAGADFVPVTPDAGDVAFLQFTSGSTGQPKGVRVTHANLVANAGLIQQGFADDARTRGVTWLPPYHDMGLIGGILQPIFLGAETVMMTPTAFVQRPLRWLEAISRYRATTSGGPDFAYALCADVASLAPPDLDLSSWTLAFSGAEPVRASTLERFASAYAYAGFDPKAFYPCYGMAETTLFVSGGVRGAGARTLAVDAEALERSEITPDEGGRPIVSCGRAAGDGVRIVDLETHRALPERRVGEVWVRGPQVADGYWGDPEASAASFGVDLTPGDGGYLRTGDLGFLEGGELFLTGRAKDLIILRGRNLHPVDLEESVAAAHAALQGAPVAAFPVEAQSPDGEPEERLVIVAEVARQARHGLDADAVGRALRKVIVEEHGVDPLAIVFIRPASLPRTSSGKVQRRATRQSYLDDALLVLGRWDAPRRAAPAPRATDAAPTGSMHGPGRAALRAWMIDAVAAAAAVLPEEIDAGEPWAAHGLDSLQGVRLMGRLAEWLGRPLSPTLLYDHPTIDALAGHLATASVDAVETEALRERLDADDGIAIIGIAARFPGGEDAHRWFEGLANGVDAVGPVPADRPGADAWRLAGERHPAVAQAGFLSDVDRHEIALFGLSPREAQNVDPQQRLLLETAWRAFEDAGVAPERLAGSATGVFVGVSSPDYARLMAANLGDRSLPVHAGTGNALSVAANRISYRFDLRGPSLAIDTACSSSLVAVHQACASLERGESELALAGGVNLLLAPDLSEIFAEAGMLSPDGRCRTFDAAANGYVRGEGCGLLVLKPLSRARADGDRVWAVIRGTAVNQDGRSNGLTAPSGAAQQAVIRTALARARVTPDEVDYVEAHGTATSLGDPIEAEALQAVFGVRGEEREALRIGSVKTNIGHLEAAAGIAGLLKVVLSLAHERLPGQLHFDTPNPHAPVVSSATQAAASPGGGPLAVLTETRAWPAASRRVAGVSSFGFGGTNAHVVLEGAPEAPAAAETPDLSCARGLWLSERDADALAALAGAAADVLDAGQPLDALAREAAVGRARFPERIAVVAETSADATRALRACAAGERPPASIGPATSRAGAEPAIAFAFPGQGAQRVGMGAELYARDPGFRRRLDACDRVLREAAGFSLVELLQRTGEGAARQLAETRFTQPALFAVELCLAELLVERGVRPGRLIGHSVGEYAAACLAGVFDREDALRLVARRAELVGDLPSGGAMLAVGLPAAQAEGRIDARADVALAVDNGAERSVLSGARSSLEPIAAALAADGIEARWLDVSHAFHSPLLDPMLPAFGEAVAAVDLRAPQCEILSNLTGEVAGAEMATPDYWVRQLRGRVRFREGLESLFAGRLDALVEVGPRATSLALARAAASPDRATGIAWLPTLRDGVREDLGVARALGELFVRGASVDGETTHEDVRPAAPRLPGVRFRRERAWFSAASGPSHAVRRRAGAHPLLGDAVDVPEPDRHRFETLVSPEAPGWLSDHRVGQAAVMPAAAFIELALAAGRRALGVEGPLELRDLEIAAALPLLSNADVRLHTLASESEAGQMRVRTFSSDPNANATWMGHSTSVVTKGEGASLPEAPMPSDETSRDIDLDALAARFGEVGIHYGPAFRGIESLSVRTACETGAPFAYGVVAATPEADEGRYGLPPTRLDACLQAIAPLLDANEALLPVGARRLWVAAPRTGWPERIEVRAWLAGPREAHLEATTLGGERLFALEGVQLAPVPGIRGSKRDAQEDLHTVAWIERGRAGGARVRLPDPSGVVEDVRPAFEASREAESITGYRSGIAALEARARTLAQAIVTREGFDVVARAAESTKARRLLARLRNLAAQAPSPPAPAADDPRVAVESDLLERCAARCLDVLAGTCDPIAELLFPNGDARALRSIYRDGAGPALMNRQVTRLVESAQQALPRDEGLAVLEIGAGTGATTEALLERLDGTRSSYWFTDLGAPLVQSAIEQLGPRHPRFEGRLLDVSRDPREQGFEPACADIVVAANVLHATPDLGTTLANTRELLASGGWLVLLEGTERLGWLDLTFGLTDGWWCFEPDAQRTDHPLIDSAQWERVLVEAGFESVTSLVDGSAGLEQDVIVARAPRRRARRSLRVLSGAERVAGIEAAASVVGIDTEANGANAPLEDAVIVARGFTDASRTLPERANLVLEEALDAARHWLAGRSDLRGSRLTFVTYGAASVGEDGGFASPDAAGVAEAGLWGVARALRHETPGLTVRIVDVGPGVRFDALARELTAEDGEDEVALRGERRFVSRLAPWVDDTRPTRLEVAVPGHLDQLVQCPAERRAPAADEVEIAVRATGLNFRDLLQALGMLGRGYAEALDQEHIPFGFECAGVVARVGTDVAHVAAGDAVIGCFTPGSLASHVTLPGRFVVPKSDRLDWAEAAALPTAWLTVWYGLDTLAALAPGEWVLIHAAAGGVGMAAVRHAQRTGARVIATAHPSKWEHLRALGVEHLASSRDAGFADRVRAWTGGAGVDVVLNCLADELALESLAVTARGGRFVELGRIGGLDAETARHRRPDVQFHAFDLGQVAMEGAVGGALDALVQRFAANDAGDTLVLPTTAFPVAEAEAAFRQLQAGRHVGKLALVRETPTPEAPFRIDPDGTYVLSGGTGGLGIAVSRWLADAGARHLVLIARNAPTPEAQQEIDRLVAMGVRVDAWSVDVADARAVENAFTALRDEGATVRGVVHGAGVLADALLEDLDDAHVRRVLLPKVHGVTHLAAATSADPLDFFVSFSSAAALFGSPGQANHAAANAILDAHAAWLRSEGRPGRSIAWGAWAQIGAAARKGAGERLAALGIGEIDPPDGLAAFEAALRSGTPYLGVAPLDWDRFAQMSFAERPFYGHRLAAATGSTATVNRLDLSGLDGPQRLAVLDEHLRAEIATVLGLSSSDEIEPRSRLMDLGMDSLMAVELKARAERSLGLSLPSTLFFDHPTVESLVAYLEASLAPGPAEDAEPTREPRPDAGVGDDDFAVEDDAAVIDDVAGLSDEDVLRRLRG
ncbi:MAG: SDR family NAD(P)-dependent oxidoreductase [Myxococcota bacterium]